MSIWSRVGNSRGILDSNALYAIVVTFVLIFIGGNAEAAETPRPVTIQAQDFDGIYLHDHAQILKDEKRGLSIQDVLLGHQEFSANTFGRRNLPTDDIYWQRFNIQNDSGQPVKAVLSHEYPIVKNLDIYQVRSGDPRLIASKTDPDPALAKAFAFRNFSVSIDLDPGLNQFYIKTENRMAPQSINFALLNPDDFSKLMLRDNSIIFGLLGIVFSAILYNLFIYLQLRHSYYVPFIFFMIFMCFSQLVDRGFFHSTFKLDLIKNHDAFLIAFGTAAANAFQIFFIIGFLNLKKSSPRWFRIALGLKWVFIATALFSIPEYWFTGKLNIATGVTGLFGVLGIPIFIVMPAYLSIKGYKPAQYFTGATLSMVIFSAIFVALVFGGIEWQDHMDLMVFGGIGMQAILFSIALGFKLRIESDDLNARLAKHAEELDIIVAEKTAKVRSILDNINLGIFRINRQLKIDNEYSKACDEIFPGINLGGAGAVETVAQASRDFGKEQTSLLHSALEFSLGHDMFSYDVNSHALPKEIIMKSGKYLEMDWMPISDSDGNLASLLVSAKDVTYIRELEINRERNLAEVHNLMNIIEQGPAKMGHYIQSERGLLQKTLTALTADSGKQDGLKLIMRNIHTIKGNTRFFGLDKISNFAHECESQVQPKGSIASNRATIHKYLIEMDRVFQELQSILDKYVNTGKLEARDYQDQIAGYLASLDQMTGQYDSYLSPRLMQLKTFLKKMMGSPLEELLAPVKSDLNRICGLLGKKVPDILINDNGIFISHEHYFEVRSSLKHIIKHSVNHGLEGTEERLLAGKTGNGKIVISLTQASKDAPHTSLPFILEIYDDGRELDVGRILKKTLADQHSTQRPVQTVGDAATAVFQAGFTSKDDATDRAGRCVGMNSIKDFISEIGGTVAIEFFDKEVENRVLKPDEVLYLPIKLVVRLPANTCV